jgi:mono/diheme cytochrome c family protein
MKMRLFLHGAFAGVFLAAAGLFAAESSSAVAAVASAPVYVSNTEPLNEPMPDGVFAWASLTLATNVPDGTEQAHFDISFTNIATAASITLITNVADNTKVAAITNAPAPVPVTIFSVHPSCSCTVAELPPMPWTIQPRESGKFGATVSLEGRTGSLIKTVMVSTDKGYKELLLEITIEPPVIPVRTAADRAHDLEIAKTNRQSIFKGDCASCHSKNVDGKYGKALYDAVCGICHDTDNRSPMVPDLKNLKTATNQDFWRVWIANSKAGTLMPAFSTTQSGPLSDIQIDTLATYLTATYPSKVPQQP